MPEGGGHEKILHDPTKPPRSVNIRDAEIDWDNVPLPPKKPVRTIRPVEERSPQNLRKVDAIALSGLANPKKLYEGYIAIPPRGYDGAPASPRGDKSGMPNETHKEVSRSITRVIEDIDEIIAERRDPGCRWTRQGAEVFFRIEAMAIATTSPIFHTDAFQSRSAITSPEDLVTIGGHSRRWREIIPSNEEGLLDEMMARAQSEFLVLVNELKELQTSGATEDDVFKKLLEQVNAFPYRKTANSLLKALAGHSRENARPKRGLLHELARANEIPGLNCEGRAKMFAGLLEAIGYSPTEDIFINWLFEEEHVQTLLKQKDGTWLVFEGNAKRPFIQIFRGDVHAVCSLQEWKQTLYGLPSRTMVDSADLRRQKKVEDVTEKSKNTKQRAWQKSTLALAVETIKDAAKELATISASSVVTALGGSGTEEEHVKNAYPEFDVSGVPEKSSVEKAAQDVTNTSVGHIDALRKILIPRIDAAKRVFGGKVGAVIVALATGCWFSYGAAHPSESTDQNPQSTEEIKEERKEWEELAQAVLHDVVIDTSQAPYVFSELDLVFKTQEGTVEQQKEGDEIVHTLKLADSVRTMSPEVFVSMVKKDITQWAEGSGATNVTWVIEGKNLDVHAAQFAITEMASTDNFIVGDAKINVLPDQIFSVTWRFTGGAEDDQITLSFSATDNGPVTARGIEWTYAMQPNDASALATIRQVEDRILTKAYGTTGWQAPL